jgi:predicted secreted protein
MLVDRDINIIQMPCPESTFGGLHQGLQRKPKGYSAYNTAKYWAHCRNLAEQVVGTMIAFQTNGYKIACILGIENSPSCAVCTQWTRRGINPQPGVFMDCLSEELKKQGKAVPRIGINRLNMEDAKAKLGHIMKNPSIPE